MKYLDPSEFPYQVDVVEDWIPLSDGTRLWMKAWMPVTEEPVPAILEYLPYRASDWTWPRDSERHPYYAGHGYAAIRVDIRGHGNSEGVPGDEYDAQEHADGLEVIDWIASQPWCTGKLGMIGISWGGFNSLQLNYLQPEPLKAIVTVCSTDDRYDNDVHYMGGSMLAVDMFSWAATMLAFESRPPDKRVWGDGWKDQWIHRLEGMDTYIDRWMSHQVRDEYWQHGSVCEDYSRMNAAVLAVGGWFDPYRDTVVRLVENLSANGQNVRGLIGPWSHQYPDRSILPGPFIDFLGETLQWWDYWLKGKTDNGAMDTPLLRSWMIDPVPPRSIYKELPGRWIATDQWPDPEQETVTWALADGVPNPVSLDINSAAVGEVPAGVRGKVAVVNSPQNVGSGAGRYFPYGNDSDLPIDQREDDGKSVTFDFPLHEAVQVHGNPKVRLRLTTAAARGQVYVRLSDVAPDGETMLITRGNLNLSSRDGREKAVDFPSDEWVDVVIPMTAMGYKIPAGHSLRVSVTNSYWPWIWPQAQHEAVILDLDHCAIDVPVRPEFEPGSQRDQADRAIVFDDPVQPINADVKYPDEGRPGVRRPERLISDDVARREQFIQVDPMYGGTRVYPDGLAYNEDVVEKYWISWDDPTSARAESEWKITLKRDDLDWEASLTADTRMHCDAKNFYTESVVRCWDGGEEIFSKTFTRTIPRVAS